MIVLDTNVISEALKPVSEPRVLDWLNRSDGLVFHVTTTTLAEMLMGIELLPDGKRKQSLRSMVDEAFERLFADRILPFDAAAARAMAKINKTAVTRGYNISFPDCQIAAIAAAHGFVVATRDEAPFHAAGVRVVNPWKG